MIFTTLVYIFYPLCSYLKCFDKDVKNKVFVNHIAADDITKDENFCG